MKRMFILASFAVYCSVSAIAGNPKTTVQRVDPRGLFRLQCVSYEDGRSAVNTPGDTYWYCSDSASMRMTVTNMYNGNPTIEMKDVNGGPLNYTGYNRRYKSQQVYNTTGDSFILRWYNDEIKDEETYPMNTYCLQRFSKADIMPGVKAVFDMLQLKIDTSANKFAGVWKRRGLQLHQMAGTTESVYGVDTMYKIYSPNKVMVIYNINDGHGEERAICRMADVKYYDDHTLMEEFSKEGNSCIIFWIDKDTFTLTYIRQGSPVTEIWDRSGLPENFQCLFGTKVPVTHQLPSMLTNISADDFTNNY